MMMFYMPGYQRQLTPVSKSSPNTGVLFFPQYIVSLVNGHRSAGVVLENHFHMHLSWYCSIFSPGELAFFSSWFMGPPNGLRSRNQARDYSSLLWCLTLASCLSILVFFVCLFLGCIDWAIPLLAALLSCPDGWHDLLTISLAPVFQHQGGHASFAAHYNCAGGSVLPPCFYYFWNPSSHFLTGSPILEWPLLQVLCPTEASMSRMFRRSSAASLTVLVNRRPSHQTSLCDGVSCIIAHPLRHTHFSES